MAFGFGFNKTKALSSAERYIQQGKLQNAIAEYEKVMKSDPKDLTVRNTVGDLYARLGDTDKALEHFRSVGDAYAAAGFTVKAIAMYKKLTKLKPTVECILKLAELYSQQGLQNDSRAQYLQVAEQMLRSGQLEAAARVFQKVLEIDPENVNMQSRLADVYLKLGRNDDARNLLQRTAEALQTRGGNPDALQEILRRLLELDPANSKALLMQGRLAMERGDTAKAMAQLKQVPNLESSHEGLRLLLRATLAEGNTLEAGALAGKLFALHQDTSGLLTYADNLMKDGAYEEALRTYDQVGAALFANGAPEVLENLKACIGHVRENATALQLLRQLFQRSGDKSHLAEVAELQAHACVQAGELEKARELYLELAAIEPDNPMHAQNYHQIVERLGGKTAEHDTTDAVPRVIEELERSAPALELEYPEELAVELRRVITDSDLFVSYNLPAKAAAPLLAVLPKAPRDPRLNQRLATLHARAGRFKEAAECCFTLAQVYRAAGHDDYAARCVEVAEHYAERAGVSVTEPMPALEAQPTNLPAAAPGPMIAQATPAPTAEIDISGDWENEVSAPATTEDTVEIVESENSELDGLLEEIRFYLQHGLWEEAESAIGKCAKQAPNLPQLATFRAQLAARETSKAAAPEVMEPAQPAAAQPPEAVVEPPVAPIEPPAFATEAPVPVEPAALFAVEPPAPVIEAPLPAAQPAAAAAASQPASKLSELVLDLEESIGAGFKTPPLAAAAAAGAAAGSHAVSHTAPVTPAANVPSLGMGAVSANDTDSELAEIFSEFKEGLEQQPGTLTEGEDPETHYNLGVAFKEMGLLDEAIGELQKVCQSVERGHTFPHVMQAFTWLAQCFLEKGVPQAAVRWYEKALKLPSIDSEARVALHYELAAAYEAAENKQAALNHFMEVYGANIEYRDVAERIKALKS